MPHVIPDDRCNLSPKLKSSKLKVQKERKREQETECIDWRCGRREHAARRVHTRRDACPGCTCGHGSARSRSHRGACRN
jgi:hypothetical protein